MRLSHLSNQDGGMTNIRNADNKQKIACICHMCDVFVLRNRTDSFQFLEVFSFFII